MARIMKNKLDELMEGIKEFSDKTFGTPEQRNEMGALNHLKLEVDELIQDTNDPLEWADCMLLLLDAARRKGYTTDQLFEFCLEKLEINKKRTWKKHDNNVYFHEKKHAASSISESYDWKEAFKYSNGKSLDDNTPDFPFQMAHISKILYIEEGENDGPSWIIMVKLKGGMYGFLSAGCDYTGWDCQAGGQSYVSKSKQKLIRFGLGEDDRKRFGISLKDDFQIDSKH